jgi:GDP-D-mannose dehydratase
LKYVKDLLNALIASLKHHIDLFHLTANTSVQLSFVNAVETLSRSILTFTNILPPLNITTLLSDNLLCDNFLKALSKKLHKLQVDSQQGQLDET